MVVYDFVQLDVPFEMVRACIRQGRARPVDAHMSPDTWVEVGAAIEEEWSLAVPFHGYRRGATDLTAVIRGHLEVTRLGSDQTHVSMMGSYRALCLASPPEVNSREVCLAIETDLRSFFRQMADLWSSGAVAIAS